MSLELLSEISCWLNKLNSPISIATRVSTNWDIILLAQMWAFFVHCASTTTNCGVSNKGRKNKGEIEKHFLFLSKQFSFIAI